MTLSREGWRGVCSRSALLISVLTAAIALAPAGCIQAPQEQVKVVAFGDSSTEYYPEMLADLLGLDVDDVANEYQSGETAEDGLGRLGMIIAAGRYPNATHLTYWQGGNDLIDLLENIDPLLIFSPNADSYLFKDRLNAKLDDIEATLDTAIGMAQAAGWTVCIATYYPFATGQECDPLPLDIILPTQAQHANEYQALLNDRIRSAAAQRGAVLVDIAEAPLNTFDYRNCNHLDDDGNEIVAEMFADAIGEIAP